MICHWYGEEQHERIAAVDYAVLALEFLAMEAQQQQQMIPDCPVCEAWSSKMIPVHDLINKCGVALSDDIRIHLENVWAACCALKALALPCYEREIFEHGAWQILRKFAQEALTAMESELIKPLLVDFGRSNDDCRMIEPKTV
ncbi:hypothetical protein A6E19_06990 [Pseudomonas putida]|nr:hypothetical protein A6E24_13715 [Pseudomonas putida]OCT29397.1 hypothetical protein A6E23_04875 [Pseudomonas putida]OCT35098.1 hypothetical protein A6E20_21060 [Pseudomonas putida]OCT39749.1 hypothetical protein A6E19_06990 [Pseudomonas putida]